MAKKELAKKAAVVRATTKEDKKTALDGALKQIEKKIRRRRYHASGSDKNAQR